MSTKKIPSEEFKSRLRAARDMRGWSQADLANQTKLPPSSIAHFESGSRKPSFENLRRLAISLEVTTDYLMGRVEEPSMAEAGDPLYRDVSKLSAQDRELAKNFLEMLARRKKEEMGD